MDISWQTIVKVFVAIFILYILFLARDVLVWFFFGLIISLLLEPAINFLRKVYVPKVIAVTLVYIIIFGILGILIYASSPIFIFEINQFIKNIPVYFEKINPVLEGLGINVAKNFEDLAINLLSQLQESSASVIKAITVFFGGIASTLLIFIFAFYISLEERGVEKFLALLVPKKYEESVVTLFEKAQFKVSRWFGARILACIFVGAASFVVFFLFGVKYFGARYANSL